VTSEPRSQKAAQTRAKLLTAAKEIFEEKGFLAATVSDIVKRGGMAQGSFYHYFDSKEDVFRELAAVADTSLHAPMQQVVLDNSSEEPPTQRIRKALRRFLEAYRRDARFLGVLEEVSRYDPVIGETRASRLRSYNKEFQQSIEQLQRHGLADPALDPYLVSSVLASITTAFPEAWLVREFVECSLDDAVEYIAQVFIRTLDVKDVPA
jgi:AcrR family transcriptional regulator